MKSNQLLLSVFLVAIAFATAWAIRGQFGHEQGAAWAGMIGTSALLLVAKREEWTRKMLPVILSGAIGWGTTGMISYGIVVGYCRSIDFTNATYGFMSLFVIGGLFGLIGGGLIGLSLTSEKKKKVNWASLLTEMVAGGSIFYYFLIDQIGLLMTPPRSEAWAICLGAGLAMLWHMARHSYNSAFRVAIFSMLGGGFGFSFGNFLQISGNVLEIPFNMWNVMEYNIGFWGGAGLAYGVFTSEWSSEVNVPSKNENYVSLSILLMVIPLIVWKESFFFQKIIKSPFVENNESVAFFLSFISLFILVIANIFLWWKLKKESTYGLKELQSFFLTVFITYILWSYFVTGIFMGVKRFEQPLYLVNLVFFLILLRYRSTHFPWADTLENRAKDRWGLFLLVTLAILIALSFFSINMHDAFPGAHERFPLK